MRPKPNARPFLQFVLLAGALAACSPGSPDRTRTSLADEPAPHFRNVDTPTSYVGDSTCATCHAREASAYRPHAMARSFHPWTPATRIEAPLETPLRSTPTGLSYTVVEDRSHLYQVEFLAGPNRTRLHELRRRMDYVMGSGQVAQTYFTEENGRLFQLPLTWYRQQGWDFSPGYQKVNGRFDRVMPDRCIACHSSYPRPLPFLEGKYAELRSGIGCERCHGPGALHASERRPGMARDTGVDNTIVNPARLPLQRRMDVCEQCHVHTSVSVLRDGKDAYSYLPSQLLSDQWAFFKVAGSIDIVSHADRLRQSKCFVATRTAPKPLECATCHNPHQPAPDSTARNTPCVGCHSPPALAKRLTSAAARADHAPAANCVGCHMPRVDARAVHGAFTEHWIRIARAGSARDTAPPYREGPVEPYFQRDKTGRDAKVYQGMGEIVYATLANDTRVLGDGAAALDSALGTEPARADARFLLGVAYQQLGNPIEAIRALEQSVRADSSRPEALRALAHAYEQAGRPAAEIDPLYLRALSLQPALAWIRAEYADFLQATGRRDDAEKAYRRATAEQPSLGVAWFNLGTVLSEAGRRAESARAFQEAVHLDPAFAQALSPLIQVRSRENDVSSVAMLASPVAALPLRERGPRAIRVTASTSGTAGVQFAPAPPRGQAEILKPDGTRLRAVAIRDGSPLVWDLRTEGGTVVAGGLYRVRVTGREADGRPYAPQLLYVGVVRQRAP